MAASEEEKYRVVLHERPSLNDLGEMTKSEVYGYVRTRLGNNMGAAEAVLRELEEKGVAVTYFESALGPKIRVEIRQA
jgi:hypothetical protein